MPDSETNSPAVEPITFKHFLESIPPGRVCEVVGAFEPAPNGLAHLKKTSIQLFCDSKTCDGVCFFDGSFGLSTIRRGEAYRFFVSFRCRHCMGTEKVYALQGECSVSTEKGSFIKAGELPLFGPHIPTKMFSLLGADQEVFHKGRRAESQGMGIGAFAYYRRVVENQKNRLIDEIIKVSKRIGADPDIVSQLEAAKNETQFHKAIEMVKNGIPDVLRINGHNPLTLLHSALSDGLHVQTDEECLIRATSIRVVMGLLAERITQALEDHAELTSAVSQLLQITNQAKQPRSAAKLPEKA